MTSEVVRESAIAAEPVGGRQGGQILEILRLVAGLTPSERALLVAAIQAAEDAP